ncbi:iron-containing alcohol dehydrogenase [Mycolicibacterium frederiksbergense]|uniref:iron-containing alcohol dehydrogenase n=1 Tax=Mycolicibacterium frederiksbergense TaxID=117567 RepID=UPI00399A4452
MIYNVTLPRHSKIGSGASEELGTLCAQVGIDRPVLITDRYLARAGQAERLATILRAAGCTPAVFSDTVPDPTSSSLQPALNALRSHNADGVIGFGGGSPMDTAKALAVLAVSEDAINAFKAPRSYSGPALPIVAVPTTAGSGSEATQFTVITDDTTDEKMLCPGLSFLPVATVVDFDLAMSMPARLTADTGVDALTHAIESYVSRRANPFTDGLALTAMRSIDAHLRRAYTDPDDRRAREAMMLASMQAGMAFSNASVALVHGMSRPIGGHFHVAHGLSNAMLLPAVTRYSAAAATDRYADCARAMALADEATPDVKAAGALVDELDTLCNDVAVPSPAQYGIPNDDWDTRLEVMAQQALASGSPANNPRIPQIDEVIELYQTIYV